VKPIVARDQVALGAMRCLKLALAGMSYRLFRSGITVSILALAVAFLVHMLSYSILADRTAESAALELRESRQLGEIVTRLGSADGPSQVRAALVAGDAARMAEYARFAGSESDVAGAQNTARRLAELGEFLSSLPPAARAVLLGDLTPEQLFERLADAKALALFGEQVASLGVVLPGLDAQSLQLLMSQQRPELERVVARIVAGHERAILAVDEAFPGKSPAELAKEPPPSFGQAVRAAGFGFDDEDVAPLKAFGARLADREVVVRLLLDPDVRAKVARRLAIGLPQVSLDAIAKNITDRQGAEWLWGVLREADKSLDLPAERLLGLLQQWQRQRALSAVASERGGGGSGLGDGRGAAAQRGLFGLDARARWLLALSFLVCVVGVANAMLMSVTERFSEIATMKCLGAMDRFVMMMFVFEAVIQGLVGGVIGIVVGVMLAALRAAVELGGLAFGALGAVFGLGLAVLGSLVVGVLLAALAAVGPAWVAARLSPMEAMRVD
jgi:hypothetical protein